MPTLDYQTPIASQRTSPWWVIAAGVFTVLDVVLAIYVGRNIVVDGSYGGIYGFGGYARPMIFLSSVVNLAAFLFTVAVLIFSTRRDRWLLCLGFLGHAFNAFIYLGVRYGL